MPVLLNIMPKTPLLFGTCAMGNKIDKYLSLTNQSTSMTISFEFRRIAHFTAKPFSGKMKPQHTQDVVISFVPKQIGKLNFIINIRFS